MTKRETYIIDAKRSPVGSFMSCLSKIPAHKISSIIIKSILNDIKLDPDLIDEVILGQVLTGGLGQNPARQTLIESGLKNSIPAFTINKVCGSGLKSVCLAANSIIAEEADIIIAGGQENMSLAMHGAYIRAGNKYGNLNMIDLMQYDGLTDVFSDNLMGITAENIAKRFNITREMQDQFALESQQKAAKARTNGLFKNEIIAIEILQKKQNILFDQDEGIREDTNIEILSKLKPAFEANGTVTAGNASTINDGSAILIIASDIGVKKYNLKPIARIVSYASAGVDPNIMGTGPVPASKKALEKAGWNINDLDLIECNEAFAAQAIYVNREMKWDLGKVNVCGGAIALGHPIGASGSRILVTLINQMKNNKAKKGLATLCIGGGMGIAICIENL